MSVDKKYYYMRLKDNFFYSVELEVIESEEKGYQYSNLLLKMYLLSLQGEGRLMAGRVPYTPVRLARATGHDLQTVEEGLRLFQELGLIEIMETGAIYMLDIQEFIGHSGTEADRKREYRHRKKLETYKELFVENPGLLLGRDKCPDKFSTRERESKRQSESKRQRSITTQRQITTAATPRLRRTLPVLKFPYGFGISIYKSDGIAYSKHRYSKHFCV